jgi:hypothetical protein
MLTFQLYFISMPRKMPPRGFLKLAPKNMLLSTKSDRERILFFDAYQRPSPSLAIICGPTRVAD